MWRRCFFHEVFMDSRSASFTGDPRAAAEYAHASTLVLGYTVTDGGSGVAGVDATPTASALLIGDALYLVAHCR
jgi:hypothetical protein